MKFDASQLGDFLAEKQLMVVSSLNSAGKPQSAVVGFAHTSNFELVFGTSRQSRKAKNIHANGAVSVVIGWDEGGTVQIDGSARALTAKELASYTEVYYAKKPHRRAFADNPDEQFFVISPSWLHYTDVAAKPWDITELTF